MAAMRMSCIVMLLVCCCAVVLVHGQKKKQEPRGSIDGNIDYKRGVGVIGSVQAQRDFIRSKNGNTRLSAGVEGTKVIAGPMRHTKPNFGGFINFSHRFKRAAEEAAKRSAAGNSSA